MKFSVLGSGSKGNCVYIEYGRTALLIDAGFSGKEIKRRLQCIDRKIEDLTAICVTHEHNDHITGVGVISRQCRIPVHANIGTFSAGEKKFGKLHQFVEFTTGDEIVIDDLWVRSFRISHDTADPVGFVVGNVEKRLGYCTDTGKASHLMAQRLKGCHSLILEFNHNLELLKNGPYPLPLQQRVRSSLGHLSNDDAADFLNQLINQDLGRVMLAHLSEINNRPELVFTALHERIAAPGETQFLVAEQAEPSLLMDV